MSLPLVPGTQWGFSTLPDEIKVEILRYRLVLHAPITSKTHYSHSTRLLLPLARVNKQLKSLATEVYYNDNTFLIRCESGMTPSRQHIRFLASPKPALGMCIRHVEIHLNAIKEGGFPYWYNGKQLTNVIEHGSHDGVVVGYVPTRYPIFSCYRRCYMPDFPKLKSLKLVLDFRGYETALDNGTDWNPHDHNFFSRGKRECIVLRAKTVEIEIRGCEKMPTPSKRSGAQSVAAIVADLEQIWSGDKGDDRIVHAPQGVRRLLLK